MAADGPDKALRNQQLYVALIWGILIGVVLSTITGDWWWIALGVAVGAAIGAGRTASARKKQGPGDQSRP